jgi:hypothetical protein
MSLKRKTLDALKAKDDLKTLDEKILNRIALVAVKTGKIKTEDEIEQYVGDLTLNEAVGIYADSRSTEATQTFKTNYEKKYNLKDGKSLTAHESEGTEEEPTEETEEEGGEGDKGGGKGKKKGEGDKGNQPDTEKVPKYVKTMMAGMKAMQDELAGLKAERTAGTRKEQFEQAIAEAGPKLQERLRRAYKRMTFKDDDDFKSYLDEVGDDIDESPEETGTDESGQQQPVPGGAVIVGGNVKPANIISRPKGGMRTPPAYKPNPEVQRRVDARKNVQPAVDPIQGLPKNNLAQPTNN